MDDRANKIAKLNDAFREAIWTNGSTYKTEGINALPAKDQHEILERVRTFNDFSEGNDPYGEHDFGSVEYEGNKAYWKIDYYDSSLTVGSEDPADPEKTTRVMTIMLTHEY